MSKIHPVSLPEVSINSVPERGDITLNLQHIEEDLACYAVSLKAHQSYVHQPIHISWRIPARGVQGVWTTDALHEKRLKADWEQESTRSHISQNAPVVCLFGHNDENVLTFASSDALNVSDFKAVIREEDNFVYCQITFFLDSITTAFEYEAMLRIDCRPIPFCNALKDVARWWSSFEIMAPPDVPHEAFDPVYSTWYSFHQNLNTEHLLSECRVASPLGYKTIIVDDGWQTLDSNRGYDFTGDWNPERIPEMADFVASVHAQGMLCMLWYSVPFVGVKSEAYVRFKDKCLTHTHRWAPVLDPRFPEVRTYLVEKYQSALTQWDIDGFKLDFIDDFRVYEDTETSEAHGRDFMSVEEAVEQLLSEIVQTLKAVKPGLLVEFRQRYTGPIMRKYGNMFRAFDCPNDSVTNRIRTTDLKLLTTRNAVHSDMVTWHDDEPVETAALQLLNVLFSVPQLSVRLSDVSEVHRKMIEVYTRYWLDNRDLLLFGAFYARQPLANYPVLEAYNDEKCIACLYLDQVFSPKKDTDALDILNAKLSRNIFLDLTNDLNECSISVFDCVGIQKETFVRSLHRGVHKFQVPPSGRLEIKRIHN